MQPSNPEKNDSFLCCWESLSSKHLLLQKVAPIASWASVLSLSQVENNVKECERPLPGVCFSPWLPQTFVLLPNRSQSSYVSDLVHCDQRGSRQSCEDTTSALQRFIWPTYSQTATCVPRTDEGLCIRVASDARCPRYWKIIIKVMCVFMCSR